MVQYDKKTAILNPNPGPFGGSYSIGYYFGADEKPCVPEKAKYFNYVEYDKDDVIVGSKVLTINSINGSPV